VQEVIAQTQLSSQNNKRILLLYEVKYQHAIEDIQTQLSENGDIFVVTGEIPITTALIPIPLPPEVLLVTIRWPGPSASVQESLFSRPC